MGHRVGLARRRFLREIHGETARSLFLFGLPFGCPLAHFGGIRDWGASKGRRAVYVSWGLSRTYLPSLKQNVGPVPCPRLVPAPGRGFRLRLITKAVRR